MRDSVGDTPGVMDSPPVWNQLRGSTRVGQSGMKMSAPLLVRARLEKCELGSVGTLGLLTLPLHNETHPSRMETGS